MKLVSYHKIRWLSLEQCVDRIFNLYDHLREYFEKRSTDTNNRKLVRDRCHDLYERITDPKFVLYILFLKAYLPLIGSINKACQRKDGLLYKSYAEVRSLKKCLLETILFDVNRHPDRLWDNCNLKDYDPDTYGEDGGLKFVGEDFNTEWANIEKAALLSQTEKRELLRNCFKFLYDIAQAIDTRFPEMDFVTGYCSFVDPTRRRQLHQLHPVVERFNKNKLFDADACLQQACRYRHDDLLDFVFYEENSKNPIAFWCDLYKNHEEYKELSLLSLLILTLSPDSCECERGFSTLTHVKNDLRSCLSYNNLNSSMAVALEERSVFEFPFQKFV